MITSTADRSRGIAVPKKVSLLSAWFKAARLSIPEIPNPDTDRTWKFTESVATTKLIRYTLQKDSDIVTVVIDREADAFSRDS